MSTQSISRIFLATLLFSLGNQQVSPQVTGDAASSYILPTVESIPIAPLVVVMKAGIDGGVCPTILIWENGQILWKSDWDSDQPSCQCIYPAGHFGHNTNPKYSASHYHSSFVDPSRIQLLLNTLESEGVFADAGLPSIRSSEILYSIRVRGFGQFVHKDGTHKIVEAGGARFAGFEKVRLLEDNETIQDAMQDQPLDYLRYRWTFDVI